MMRCKSKVCHFSGINKFEITDMREGDELVIISQGKRRQTKKITIINEGIITMEGEHF